MPVHAPHGDTAPHGPGKENDMSVRMLLLVAAFAGAIAMFGATASAQSVISFTSAAVGSTGVSGSGTISPGAATDESSLAVQWQGLVAGSIHMVSQYHGVSCGNYDLVAEFVYSTVTADSQGKATGVITVKKPFKNWPNRVHFIILHETAQASSSAIACGLVVAQAVPAAAATAPPAATPAGPATGNAVASARENRDSLDGTLLTGAVLLAIASIAAIVSRGKAKAARRSRWDERLASVRFRATPPLPQHFAHHAPGHGLVGGGVDEDEAAGVAASGVGVGEDRR